MQPLVIITTSLTMYLPVAGFYAFFGAGEGIFTGAGVRERQRNTHKLHNLPYHFYQEGC